MNLVCLMRGDDPVFARKRLAHSLAQTGVTEDEMSSRIEVVLGDVSHPGLGLPATQFDQLANDVDLVYHCAAEVNWARPFSRLRLTNTLPVLELLRLCCTGPMTPMVFVSTLAVCFSPSYAGRVDELTDMFPHAPDMPLGYAQSKCVAESLLHRAAERGLPVSILRPGLICGDSESGQSNDDDLLAALIDGCSRAGSTADSDWMLDCVPVDFVADVLSRVPKKSLNGLQVLHLCHDKPRTWREFVSSMNLYGCKVELMPSEAWLSTAFTNRDRIGRRLYAYRRFFQPGSTGKRPYECYLESKQRRVSSTKSQQAFSEMGVPIPDLSGALVGRYLDYYRGAGLLQGFIGERPLPAGTVFPRD